MTVTMLLSALVCFLGAACIALAINVDRLREERNTARTQLESLQALVQRHEQCVPRWAGMVKALLTFVRHSPLDHDYIKDEKACPTCRDIAVIKALLDDAERMYGPIPPVMR